jgi:hypothetical protein
MALTDHAPAIRAKSSAAPTFCPLSATRAVGSLARRTASLTLSSSRFPGLEALIDSLGNKDVPNERIFPQRQANSYFSV